MAGIIRAAICVAAVCAVGPGAGLAIGQEKVAELKVGDRAPDFTVTGIDGKKFSLRDKLRSGKHIVLIFSRARW